MVTQEAAIDKLSQFIKEYDGDQCSLELLLFLGRHPHTRFSRLVIVHALDARRVDIDRALQHLINKGLVVMHAENGVPLYSLTEDESLRSLAIGLSSH